MTTRQEVYVVLCERTKNVKLCQAIMYYFSKTIATLIAAEIGSEQIADQLAVLVGDCVRCLLEKGTQHEKE